MTSLSPIPSDLLQDTRTLTERVDEIAAALRRTASGEDITSLLLNGKGFVAHAAAATLPRPLFASVEWYGSVTPLNAIDGDTWIDTSVPVLKARISGTFQAL